MIYTDQYVNVKQQMDRITSRVRNQELLKNIETLTVAELSHKIRILGTLSFTPLLSLLFLKTLQPESA